MQKREGKSKIVGSYIKKKEKRTVKLERWKAHQKTCALGLGEQ